MATAAQLSEAGLQFLRDRHLATFSSITVDGAPHVTPVGFTWDHEHAIARVITSGTSRKARNAARGDAVVLCQLDGRRWLSLQGTPRVTALPEDVADAVARYAQRYRVPRQNPKRVAVEIAVSRLYGSAEFFLA
jgi:F420H(2)-dependent biliverdin reductase